MNAKHQFKYTYNDTDLEEFSPVDVTFDMPGDVTITQMLWNFQCYLKACGFVFDGNLEVVPEEGYDLDEDKTYGCMTDWEDEDFDGTKNTSCCDVRDDTLYNESSSCLDKNAECISELPTLTKIFNKGLKKLEAEVKKQKWVHGMCNPPSPDWKKKNSDSDSDNCWNS
jgi:hypothetical protein